VAGSSAVARATASSSTAGKARARRLTTSSWRRAGEASRSPSTEGWSPLRQIARADVAGGGAIEDLQMRDGRAGAGEFGVEAFEQRSDDGGGRERGFKAQLSFPVQPAQGGFGGGIAGVVDIEELATGG
jgi:hypothetical protein